MASASTRGLRSKSSRFSSPGTIVDREAESKVPDGAAPKNGHRTFLDKWVEPPLRPPAPSFEDTKGLERVGVLEHMAPLGQLPSQKMLQKLKLSLHRPSLRAAPGQSEDAGTPTTETERLDFPSPTEPPGGRDSVHPEEATPMSSPERQSISKQMNGEMSPQVDTTPSPRKASYTPSMSTSPMTGMSSRKWPADRMNRQIENAIAEAEKAGSPELIPGLRRLHRDALTDPGIWTVLESMLNQSPSRSQYKTFKRYIKRERKHYLDNFGPDSHHTFAAAPFPLTPSQFRSDGLGHQTALQDLENLSASPQHPSPYRLKPSPAIISHRTSPAKTSMSPARVVDDPSGASENGHLVEPSTELQSSPRKRRSRSASTSSSLSSAKSIPESFGPAMDAESEAQLNGVRSVRSSGQRQAANRVAAGSRSRPSATMPTHPKHPFADFPTTSKLGSKRVKRTREEIAIDEAEVEKRRDELEQESVLDYNYRPFNEINDRTAVDAAHAHPLPLSISVPPAPVVHAHPLLPSHAALSSPVSLQAPPDRHLTNGTSRKRPYNEIDQDSSEVPTRLSSSPPPVLVPPPTTTVGSSRAVTPRAAKAVPPVNARKSARVMVSPNKPKNGGTTAGISRAGTGRDPVIGNGGDSGAEDNDEYCASCGGEGTLLCCDGCTNSFHHSCLEPPLDPDAEVDGEWFCPQCIARRNKVPTETSGLFGRIIRHVDDIIPKAFTLPFDIRDYFEGVRTGEEGEYEEVGLPRTQNNAVKMNRAGFFEEPNYKELRDGKGNFISCYRCGLTSNGRDIIPCDYCPARWHLDCLDPPLAVPPRRRIGDKPNASWRCPLHAEHDLAQIGQAEMATPGDLGRIPRLRRPKNAAPFDVAIPRGFRNNGVIDVELGKDEVPDIKEVEMMGRVYRLPETGIRLDFVDRVKRSWYEDQTFPKLIGRRKMVRESLYRPHTPVTSHSQKTVAAKVATASPISEARGQDQDQDQDQDQSLFAEEVLAIQATARANAELQRKSFREQEAVLCLAGLGGKDSSVLGNKLADLTNQLIASAPQDVAELVQRDEVASLERLMELAHARLAVLRAAPVPAPVEMKVMATTLANGRILEKVDSGVGVEGEVNEVKAEYNESGSEMDITD